MQDVQMDEADSAFTMQDAQMDEADSLCTMVNQQNSSQKSTPKDRITFLTKLPAEMRNHIYDQALTNCPVHTLIYKHPDITHPSLATQAASRLAKKAGILAADPAESRITKIIDKVIKNHPFILLSNRQITFEYSGCARKHIIHALGIDVSSLVLLRTWSKIPRNELARLKLTINFGGLTNDVNHAHVREHIVAFIKTLPNLVDLQILYKHDELMNLITSSLMNDWQTIRYELLYDLLPLLKKIQGGKQKTVRIFPFVTMRGGWKRIQFP
ncbi:hypothetical protein E2P81_ATG09360 [Venturia nashicola]|nr:hypothetical protein E2P81_ATG09360 [Venturia nashicola]